jgi:hypothetical protein
MIGVKSTPQSTFSRVDTATQRGERGGDTCPVHARGCMYVFGGDLARLFCSKIPDFDSTHIIANLFM